MDYLIGLVVALLGAFLYQRNKTATAEARNENLEVKEDLLKNDQTIAKNNGELEAEEKKQAELKKELDNTKAVQDTITNIIDFLNKRKK
jgi:uncharacterized membrane protein YgaE (UPF0421/DUF939 family)